MRIKGFLCPIVISILFLFVITSCNNKRKQTESVIAVSPDDMQKKAPEIIRSFLERAISDNGRLEDSIILNQPFLSKIVYEKYGFEPLWCRKEQWLSAGDSLIQFIDNSKLYGLFPDDYHVKEIMDISKKFRADSFAKKERKDASLWSKADILLTNAFVRIIKDIKLGRLPQDSVTLRKDSVLSTEFYLQQFQALHDNVSPGQLIAALEPKQRGYQLLKKGIQKFLDSADYRQFSMVPSPGKNPSQFKKALQKRLYEEGFIESDSISADSLQLAGAVKKFQQKKGIAVDGRAGEGTIRMLNMNDREKFIRIAISMDKFKMLPENMPSKYIWVNLPGYQMQLIEMDSVKISSKVICGKPKTRTPVLTSAISELITYPQWVPPPSIILKEILPAVKKTRATLPKKDSAF